MSIPVLKNLQASEVTQYFDGANDMLAFLDEHGISREGTDLEHYKTKNTANNDGVSDTGIRFSKKIEDYPYNMQTVISEYISAVDEDLLENIDESLKDKSKFKRFTISNVSNRLVDDIKRLLGIDVSGYKNSINTNAIAHIDKEHGGNGITDHSMANRKDLARITYILDNYDDIEVATYASGEFDTSAEFRNSNNTPAKMVILSKKINGTYYVAQAVPETAYKKLWVVSAYIKSGELTQVPDNSGGYLASRSTANNIIPDTTEKSNNNSENTKERKSERLTEKELEDELNNSGIVLNSKDNNKNNLRIKKYIVENYPELSQKVVFSNDKIRGYVTVNKIKSDDDIVSEENLLQLKVKEQEENRKRKDFYNRVKTPSGNDLLFNSIENRLKKDGVDAVVRRSKSYFNTISFYVDVYNDAIDDVLTIKISDHFTESQKQEYPDEPFIDVRYCTGFSDVYNEIKKIIQEYNAQHFDMDNEDIRYHSRYTDIDLNTLDDNELRVYNNRGWASDLFTEEDHILLNEKFNELNKKATQKTDNVLSDGSRVVEVNNKLVLIGGTFKDPIIYDVLVINSNNETEADIVKEFIRYESAEYRTDKNKYSEFLGFVQNNEGKRFVRNYNSDDFYHIKGRNTEKATLPNDFNSYGYTKRFSDRGTSDTELESTVSEDSKVGNKLYQARPDFEDILFDDFEGEVTDSDARLITEYINGKTDVVNHLINNTRNIPLSEHKLRSLVSRLLNLCFEK